MNTRVWALLLGVSMALSGSALAAKPGYIHVKERMEINASPARVWALVKDWNGLHKWHPAFSNTEIFFGTNNKAGSFRKLTLADGGAQFDEELLGFSEKQMLYSYRIVGDSPLPVADYVSSVKVIRGKSKASASLVWKGKFMRRIADDPPPGEDDASARKAIVEAYRAGLKNVKKLAETRK